MVPRLCSLALAAQMQQDEYDHEEREAAREAARASAVVNAPAMSVSTSQPQVDASRTDLARKRQDRRASKQASSDRKKSDKKDCVIS